ncbi:hypothetical protein SO802_017579 [Lithocarpus litseifolius]|uniref:Uncharacterized protein n=1 Tax=Lithocarpus litseifolius TaxID=425828 RepID=A0AAW2CJY8_9ROSI
MFLILSIHWGRFKSHCVFYLTEGLASDLGEGKHQPRCFMVMPEDYARMARAILLYIFGAYLFANGGQTVSLKWLAPFRDFEDAWGAN